MLKTELVQPNISKHNIYEFDMKYMHKEETRITTHVYDFRIDSQSAENEA